MLGVVDIDSPGLASGLLIEGYDVIIGSAEEDFAVADRDAAVLAEGGLAHRAGVAAAEVVLVLPDEAAGGGIEGEDLAVRRRDVHHAVDHDGRGLQVVAVIAGLKNPGGG